MSRKKQTSPDETASFEASLEALELIVKQMETEKLSLQDALKCFEKGVTLADNCSKALQTAELKVQLIQKQRAHEENI